DAGQHRARACTPVMPVAARRLAGDPLALAVRERGLAVKTRRNLHAHPRPAARQTRHETNIELARLVFEDAGCDFDAGLFDALNAQPRGARVRIAHRGDHARDAGPDQGLIARRRAAVVVARLERNIGGGAARAVPRCFQRIHFGVRAAGALVPAFADHRAVAHDHATDARIGRSRIQPALRELQRLRHVTMIVSGKEHKKLFGEPRTDTDEHGSAMTRMRYLRLSVITKVYFLRPDGLCTSL